MEGIVQMRYSVSLMMMEKIFQKREKFDNVGEMFKWCFGVGWIEWDVEYEREIGFSLRKKQFIYFVQTKVFVVRQ